MAWQPTPVFLPGEFHGQRNLAGYSPQSQKESDMTEATHTHTQRSRILTAHSVDIIIQLLIYVTKRSDMSDPLNKNNVWLNLLMCDRFLDPIIQHGHVLCCCRCCLPGLSVCYCENHFFTWKNPFSGNYTLNLEKATAPHSSTLAWKIPWTEEPGRLQSMGLHRVGHD